MIKPKNFFTAFSLAMLICVVLLGFASVSHADNGRDENNHHSYSFCDSGSRLGNWWKNSDWCKDKKDKEKPPVVYIFATKYSIKSGQSTELYLKTKNQIDSCTASDGWSGNKSPDVRESVSPTETTKYTITCSNQYGSYSDSVEIYVKKGHNEPPTPTSTPPTLDFSGNPLSIESGGSSNLSWSSTNTNFCLASNGWSGFKSLSGNQSVSPTATTTYTLACGGSNGTTTKSVIVDVSTTTPDEEPAPTIDLTASPLTIYNGDDSTLSWSSTHATSCSASGGWSGSKAITGTQVISPSATTTYSLSCSGAGGTANDSVTVEVWATSTPPANLDHIVISEVYYDVGADKGAESSNEWIEIYNGTGSSVDLSGWSIADTSDEFDLIPSGNVIPNNSYLVITASSTTSGFWSDVSMLNLGNRLGNQLGNDGDSIYLKNAASSTIDSMSYGSTTPKVFDPTAPDVAEGHSLKRTSVTVDTNTATDWEDEDTPTPGSL